ncbi:hypothetical protein VP1G_07651 [Cytospora mali]|uniref:Uncharacterized protein n=1 Tax=Cytospora mali TaxID=578113 RepID=A0A194V999_CYTMA|nr:hypothetical protein VP1G_07651 [Valsa mali var. pyri (nom. inval.)]
MSAQDYYHQGPPQGYQQGYGQQGYGPGPQYPQQHYAAAALLRSVPIVSSAAAKRRRSSPAMFLRDSSANGRGTGPRRSPHNNGCCNAQCSEKCQHGEYDLRGGI